MTEALLVVAQSGNAEAIYRLGSLAKLSGDAAGPAEAGWGGDEPLQPAAWKPSTAWDSSWKTTTRRCADS